MEQPSSRFCLRCGTPSQAGQRFCSVCGLTMNTEANNPTAQATDDQTTLASPSTTGSIPLPPPPPDALIAPLQQAQASSYSTLPSPGSFSAVPSYIQAPKRSRARRFAIVLLLVLVLAGIGATGYFVFFRHSVTTTNNSNQSGTSTSGQQSTSNGGSTAGGNTPTPGSSPTASEATMEPLNLQFTYASEEITFTSVQEATSFSDDLQPSQGPYLVRITLNENNPTRWHAGFGLFSDVAHLLLPDGTTANVNTVKSDGGLDANASRTNNWIDFAVSSSIPDLSKLILRMGTPTEHQMDIPLMPNADLSQYQPKTITPNTPISYGGLNWTLLSATLSLSGDDGMQATAGMRYVILSLRVDNPTSQDVVIGFPGDYMRLKSTDAMSAPIVGSTMTLPGHAAAHTTNVTGTVFFLMPENDTAFTLEWLVSTNPVYDPVSNTQVNTNFQI